MVIKFNHQKLWAIKTNLNKTYTQKLQTKNMAHKKARKLTLTQLK